MTFDECKNVCESIKGKFEKIQTYDGFIVKVMPLPTSIKAQDLEEWIHAFWPYKNLGQPRQIDELKQNYQDFDPSYLVLLSKDDPTSFLVPRWVRNDFPDLLNKAGA